MTAAERGATVVRIRGWSFRFRVRAAAVGAGCAALALAVSVYAIATGDYPLRVGDVVRTLAGGGDQAEAFVVHQLRLPRAVTGLLVGAALGLAGAIFQAVTRNPLGSPDILGFTQGATAGALVAIVVVGGSSTLLAGGALAGALATGVVIYVLAWQRGLHGYRLVLVGVGIGAMLTGVNGYLLTQAQVVDAGRAVRWLTGSLDGRGWADALPVAVAVAVLTPLVLAGLGRGLRTLELGDEAATGLGTPVERVRFGLVGSAVVLGAGAAAAAGPVAFVALTAPQLARRLTRSPGPNLLPSLCLGAALLVSADLLGQLVLPDRQVPAGVTTGLLGGAYLMWLLTAERRKGRL